MGKLEVKFLREDDEFSLGHIRLEMPIKIPTEEIE
jgi:hypothetical protein